MTSKTTSDQPKRTISCSALQRYWKCPEQYRIRYQDMKGKPEPKSLALVEGSAFHAGIESAVQDKIAGVPIDLEKALVAVRRSVVSDYENPDTPSDADELSRDIYLSGSLQRAAEAAKWYIESQMERLRPLASEESFEIPIEDTGWYLNGKIDLLETDSTIRDFKLSGRAPDVDIADKSVQLTIYALAFWLENDHKLPRSLELDYTITTKRTHGLVRASTRTEKQVLVMLERIKRTIKAIETGEFPPANPESLWCSHKWCPFFAQCPFGGKK